MYLPTTSAWIRRRLQLAMLAMAFALTACSGATKSTRDNSQPDYVNDFSVEEIVAAGDLAASQGDPERALLFFSQAAEFDESADVWFKIGRIQSRLGSDTLAWKAFGRVLQIELEHAGAHEELGLIYLKNKKKHSARQHLDKAVQIDSSRWRSHNALGVLSDLEKEYDKAGQHYRAAIAINPNSAMLLNNLGYSYYLAGHLRQAEDLYRDAIRHAPTYQPALTNIALLYARQRQYEQAIDTLREVVEPAQAYNDVGYLALRNGDFDDAHGLLKEAIRLSPQYYDVANQNLKLISELKSKPPGPVDDKELLAETRPTVVGSPPILGIVTATKLNVRTSPLPDAKLGDSLAQGETVEILYRDGSWLFVAYSDASDTGIVTNRGWVHGDYLSMVSP